ncbi:FAD:protein FMN transferase [Roseivivax sediminis]|uniref:FAD:protein FMN transferase n=1 Tax=Roseivivax sediminis TaxID=936889 RepID=A0A1I1VRZ4_9RHOB|nr:FAD:protein FMN transferase [Roseivivax sediminis]SFD84818.1 thiamine biosynthesis lipoprotein [Roseivivax sediminis]
MPDHATTFSRRRAMGMGAAALLAPGAAFASAGLETIHGAAFGTTWRVTGPAGSGLEALRRPVDQLLAGIDRRMSPWRSDSEVGRFNSSHAGGHAISDDTATVTAAALRVAEESGGCFDPTFGPAVSHWGFGPITGGGATGWRGLALSGGRLTKAWSDLTFDPCGIAKGWALDRLADLAQAAGHADLLLDLGGELAAVGHHPSGRPWQVAIEDPRPARTGLAAALTFEAGAVATSGLRAQSYALDGRTYGHIIDPTTGEPVQGRLLSVTVLARSAMEADAWATALFAAGDAEGPALARRRGLRAVFLFDDNGLRQETTGGADHALL